MFAVCQSLATNKGPKFKSAAAPLDEGDYEMPVVQAPQVKMRGKGKGKGKGGKPKARPVSEHNYEMPVTAVEGGWDDETDAHQGSLQIVPGKAHEYVAHEKELNIFRVGIFLGFVRLTTRAPESQA